MIGQLRGILLTKQAPTLMVDVHGVGYEVEAPMSTFYDLPAVGNEVTLLTHLIVREDAHLLFGFKSAAERRLFRDLIKVSGIGPRLGLAILSGIAAEDFARCVHDGDAATLTRLPGIGKKTAERLIIEMRDRIPAPTSISGFHDTRRHSPASLVTPSDEAISALTALGYKPAEALRLVQSCDATGLSSEELIRRALQAAVKR